MSTVHEVTLKLLVKDDPSLLPVGERPWDLVVDDELGIFASRLLESRTLPVKICANERCDNEFVFQEGRATSPSRRIDAMYCSEKCARAQAQRAYRRRAK